MKIFGTFLFVTTNMSESYWLIDLLILQQYMFAYAYVIPGSTFVSDLWGACRTVNNLGYYHLTIYQEFAIQIDALKVVNVANFF